jgi:hypothetical protein
MPLSLDLSDEESAPRFRVNAALALDAGDEKWPPSEELEDLKSLVSLANQMVRAVRPGDVADDIGDGAESMHVNWRGIGHVWATLHEDTDLALIAQSLLGGRN